METKALHVTVKGRDVHEYNSVGLALVRCHAEEDAKRAAAYINCLRDAKAELEADRAKLVEAVRAALTWARANKQRAGTLNVEQMSVLLADLGEYDQ